MELAERAGGVLVLEGEVAGIVIHADAAADGVWVRGLVEEELEEFEGLGGVFEMAEGLRFEAEVEIDGGGGGEFIDERRDFQQGWDGIEGGCLEGFEGGGEGGDGAAAGGRGEGGEDGEEVAGVGEAFGPGPIGLIDFFLHAGAVEIAVGETVDGEDRAIVTVEPVAEAREGVAVEEFAGGAGGQAEADGVGFAGGADEFADGEGVGFEGAERFLPAFGGVDVGAIGELAVGKAHEWGETVARVMMVASGKGWKHRNAPGGLPAGGKACTMEQWKSNGPKWGSGRR